MTMVLAHFQQREQFRKPDREVPGSTQMSRWRYDGSISATCAVFAARVYCDPVEILSVASVERRWYQRRIGPGNPAAGPYRPGWLFQVRLLSLHALLAAAYTAPLLAWAWTTYSRRVAEVTLAARPETLNFRYVSLRPAASRP